MIEENKVVLIPIDEIIPNRFQPRLKFNEKELQSLAESISEHGIVSPIIVRKIGDKYEIIAGERRFKAANLIGLTTVPCIIKELDDQESAEIAVIENLQRSNLTPIEEAKSYDKLLSKGITQEQLAKRLGVSQPTIANKVRLLNLSSEVQEALLNSKISERHARSLLQIADENVQKNLLNTVITNRLTVKQTDDEVNALLGRTPNAPGTQDIFDVDVNEVKENAQEIIKPIPKIDFESLLKKEEKSLSVPQVKNNVVQDIIRVPDQDYPRVEMPVTTVSKEPITTQNIVNPFDEEENMSPFQSIVKPIEEAKEISKEPADIFPVEIKESNPIIQGENIMLPNIMNEFHQEQKIAEEVSIAPTKIMSEAINTARDAVNELQNKGFKVDTEEFDFEDMYQIVIKIKKN